MDINNNQLINTFIKGMNTDTSDALIDSSQYRYAENLRLVTNTDSNSGELRLIEGTSSFDWDKGAIKAMTSIRDLLIVVGSDDKIWVKDTSGTTYGTTDWKLVYQPEEDLFGDYLSLVCRWETETLIKLYIADAKHLIMYINIAPDVNGNIKTVTGVNNILANAEVLLPPIKAEKSLSSGTIPPAKVLYVYRMYKLGGAATTLSVASNVVTLYKTENEGYADTDTHTSRAVDLTIPNVDVEELSYLLIYRINYQQIGLLPAVSLVYDDKYIETFIDRGQEIESTTLTELLAMVKLNIIPTVIESKNDYMFAANLEYKINDLDRVLTNNWEDTSIARAYSSGDFPNQTFPNCSPSQYKDYAMPYNAQFDSDNIMQYDDKYWRDGNANRRGDGEYISWRIIHDSVFVDTLNRMYEDRTKETQIERQVLSLLYGEVYRYGAVFYDNKGNKSSVFWIADIMAPSQGGNGVQFPTCYGYFNGDPLYAIPTIGVQFIVNKFPEGVSGIEIVRCQRTISDMLTITQGMCGLPYRIYTRTVYDSSKFEDTEMICPTGLMASNNFYADGTGASEDDNRNRSIALTDKYNIMFASPEYVYQPDDIQNIIKDNKNNLILLALYNGYTDSDSITTQDGSGSARKYVRTKSYNGISDHSFWYRFSQGELIKYPTYDGSAPNGTLIYDELTANVNYSPIYGAGRYVFELDYGTVSTSGGIAIQDVREPIFVQEMPLLIRDNNDSAQYSVVSYAFPKVPDWNQFFDDQDSARWMDDITAVASGTLYVAWSVPLLNGSTAGNGGSLMKVDDGHGYENIGTRYPSYYPVGSTGKCIIFTIDNPLPLYSGEDFRTPVMNLRKKNVPYGGRQTVDYSSYLSYGNFVLEHKYNDGTSEYYVDVFDGDTYPGVFTYNASHAWFDANTAYGARYVSVYYMPCLSTIDLKATYGDLYPKLSSSSKYYVQDKASAVSDRYTQVKDAYLYNTAYGAQPTAIQTPSLKHTEIDTNKYDTRVHHSELKTNGEHIDNWLNYRAMNFLDVDSRFGQITNMRLFKDKLLYWQKNGVGILSVNERTLLNDIDDNLIILGTGDVLLRYDYISTLHGMKPFLYEAEVQSNTTQYWWDGYNKEILAYAGGTELVPLAKIKNLTNYINNNEEINHPSLSYDIKFNELMCSVVDNNTLTYNEQVQLFTSTYTFNPIYRTIINNNTFITDQNNIYKWNGGDGNAATLFGAPALPKVQYVVNPQTQFVKVFDMSTFGGRFYGGDEGVDNLTFTFKTPLKQESTGTGSSLITNREYDFRLDIPRNAGSSYGDRMRGKTMQCELRSSSNSTDFSLQYIVTKYRMSWS